MVAASRDDDDPLMSAVYTAASLWLRGSVLIVVTVYSKMMQLIMYIIPLRFLTTLATVVPRAQSPWGESKGLALSHHHHLSLLYH